MNSANFVTPRIQSSASSVKGRRTNNEDFILYFEPSDPKERQEIGCIYIVADGVGGASIGERASKFAAEKVKYEYIRHPEIEPAARLRQAIMRANRDIFDYAEEKDIRMATTITVAVVIGNSLIVANVGDSRVYLIRNGKADQITNDHNIVGELIRGGSLTEAQALKSKVKNRLTRSIGGNEDVHVDIFGPRLLQPNDKILLCSDGLTRYAIKDDIEKITGSNSPDQITKDAVDFAVKQGHGGADNISVITVVYESANMETVKSARPGFVKPIEEWELSETDPGFTKRKRLQLKPTMWLFSAVIILSLVMIFALGGLLNIIGENSPVEQAEATQSVPPTVVPEATETQVITTPQPTNGLTVGETPISENGGSIPAGHLSPTPTSEVPEIYSCKYTIQRGDILSDIARRFGVDLLKITCASESPGECDLSNRDRITTGWIVIIQDVNKDICIQNGGQSP